MSIDEDQLRHALHGRAERIDPSDGSWDRIQAQLSTARRRRQLRSGGLTGLAAAAAAALVFATVTLVPDDARVVETGPAAPSQTAPTPDLPPPPDVPAPPVPPGPSVAPTVVPGIWPLHTVAEREAYLASGATRYHDAAEVARAFAVDYLGMADPVVGRPSTPGPEGTVEVKVQPHGEGGLVLAPGVLETTVHLGPDGPPWQVRYTRSTGIRLDGDLLRNGVTSPIAVSGEGTAYEGTVQVEVRQAGMEDGASLGRDVVTAGSQRFGPFAGEIAFRPPTTEGFGALVLSTESAVDGSTEQATVVALNFATGASAPTPTSLPATQPNGTEVTVFFSRGEDVVAVTRSVPKTTGVLRAALEQLLAGPTDEERASGLSSWFSSETAGLLSGVTLGSDGRAVVDFGDLRPVIPNASTSAGSAQLLAQLNATVMRFPTVDTVEFRIGGSCEAFFEWLQRPCQAVERPGS